MLYNYPQLSALINYWLFLKTRSIHEFSFLTDLQIPREVEDPPKARLPQSVESSQVPRPLAEARCN